MSSKRGRKRNDNLPPNRARDVQRAFRARRAAHLEVCSVLYRIVSPLPALTAICCSLLLVFPPSPLRVSDSFVGLSIQALEQRVAELEDENNTLRAALSLPPANRLPLGKGPTGKDKPKPYAPRSSAALASVGSPEPAASGSGPMALPPASRTESPSSGSTRTHSLSPSSLSAVLNSSGQPTGLPDSWDEGMFSARERPDVPPSSSYPVTPVSSTNSQPPYSFSSSTQPPTSRPSVSTYGLPLTQNYPHSADRPAGEGYSDSLFDRRFHFPQSAYSDSSHTTFNAQSPTPPVSLASHRGSNGTGIQNLSFAHRRSITEPQALRTALLSSMPGMLVPHSHSHAGSGRGPSPNMSETVGHLRAAEFDVDPRVNQMNTLPS
jgi:hypothetical protein